MKFIIYILLFTTFCQAQDKVSLSVFQDVKFALQGDVARGYKAGTLNILARLKMQGNQDELGYFVVVPEFEHADLQGTYRRYSVNLGYTLNSIKKIEVTPMINYGWIDRGVSTYSGGASIETMYKLTDNIKIGVLNQLVHRTDLPNRKLGYSFFFGTEINLK